jgi:hypothetical protein
MTGKRVQMLPTTKDEDRLEKSLVERAPDRVYILYNKEPLGMHESLNNEVTDNIEDLVQRKTMCGEHGEIRMEGIEFYQFDDALVDVFELVYKESQQENDVLVNVSGGTKPVAIALAYACSLVANAQPLYYVAKDYPESNSQGDVSSDGVVDRPFELSSLQSLDISDIIPEEDDIEKEKLLFGLLNRTEPVGVTKLLSDIDVITPNPPDDEDLAKEREQKQQTYHSHMRKLHSDNIVDKEGQEYFLTESGELIARLVRARKRAEEDI